MVVIRCSLFGKREYGRVSLTMVVLRCSLFGKCEYGRVSLLLIVICEWGPLPMGSGPFFILKFFLESKEKRCILPGRIVRVRRANVTHEMNCPTVLAYHSTPLLSAALTPPLTRGGLTPEPSRAAGEVGMSFIGRSPVCMFSLGPKGRLCGFMRRTGSFPSVYIPYKKYGPISGNIFRKSEVPNPVFPNIKWAAL